MIGQEIHTYIHITEQSNPLWAVIQVSTISASSTFPVPSHGTTEHLRFLSAPSLDYRKSWSQCFIPFFFYPEINVPISLFLSGLLPSEITMQEANRVLYLCLFMWLNLEHKSTSPKNFLIMQPFTSTAALESMQHEEEEINSDLNLKRKVGVAEEKK